jgi:hypothetical protein
LPFEELVDWNKFAVVMTGSEMVGGGLSKKIGALQSQVPLMQQELARVRHMFTYNYTMHYIVDTLLGRFNT